jgi:hypothetical protein
VEEMRLVALDLKTGSATLLSDGGDAALQLEGPPTLGARGLLMVTNAASELIRIDAHGVAVSRTALEPAPPQLAVDGGTNIFRRLDDASPPLIADPAGRVAFVRSSGKLGIVDEKGGVSTVDGSACRSPLSVLPAGPRRIVVVCKNGAIAMYGDS